MEREEQKCLFFQKQPIPENYSNQQLDYAGRLSKGNHFLKNVEIFTKSYGGTTLQAPVTYVFRTTFEYMGLLLFIKIFSALFGK